MAWRRALDGSVPHGSRYAGLLREIGLAPPAHSVERRGRPTLKFRPPFVPSEAGDHPRRAERNRSPFSSGCLRRAGARPVVSRRPPSQRGRATCWSRSSISFRSPPECVQAGIASVEADYAAVARGIPDGRGQRRGVFRSGQAAAAAILALRAADGSDAPLRGFRRTRRGRGLASIATRLASTSCSAGWGNVTPFVLKHGAQFRPRPPNKVTQQEVRSRLQ